MGYAPTVYPSLVNINCLTAPVAAVGVWTPTFTTNQAWGAGINQSDGVQNDAASWDALLGPGTWTLQLGYRADTSGIYTITIDGASLTSLGGSADTIDGYAAAPTATVTAITGIVLPGPAKVRRIKLLMATKNASSASYIAKPCFISLTRTA